MAQAIVYCDRCARLITPGDIQSGRALCRNGSSICAPCLENMPDDEREQLASSQSSTAPVSKAGSQVGSKRISNRDAKADEPQRAKLSYPLVVVAMAVAGVLLGVSLVLVLMPGRPNESAPAPAALPAVPRVTTVPSVAPVLVPEAASVDADAGAVAPAPLPPDQRDAQYAESADRALEAAIAEAVTMAARGQFDEAEAIMKDVGPRFAEGPWLAATGQKRIDATLADVARMRKLAAESEAKQKAEEKDRQGSQAGVKPPADATAEAPDDQSAPAPEGVADNALWTEPGAFVTNISKSDLDGNALAEWVDGSERQLSDYKVDEIIYTRDGAVSWRGVEFGKSSNAGMRHLRFGFTRPVTVASLITRLEPDMELSVLRNDAPYPGDLSDEAQWRSAWRPRPANASVWVLPPGTTTRALRFSCSRSGVQNQEIGKYHGAIVLAHAVSNVATDALVTASYEKGVSLINDGDHGWFADTNWLSNHAARDEPVSREKPEWVLLTWPRTVLLRGLSILDAGFKSVDVFIYSKDGEASLASDEDWIKIGTIATRCQYPRIIAPTWIDFGSVREVKAAKLVITESHRTNELHPHRREGYCYDGKCVWLGEVLALKPFADSPLLGLIRRVGDLGERAKADPATDGFWLNTEIIYALAKAHDADKVKAKCIASVGGAVAASPKFDRSLTALLEGSAGYAFPSRSGVARARLSVPALLKGIDEYLERHKPEVVRVCFDTGSLQRVADPKSLEPGIRDIVKRIQSSGAIPVLFTMPAPQFRDENAEALIASYDEMIVAAAADLRVPYIDARSLLNNNASKHFTRNGALLTQAYATMNSAFYSLYWALEASVFARAEIPKAVAVKKTDRATEQQGAEPQDADGQQPDGQGMPPPPPVAPPRTSSLVVNGGFEQRDDETRFATGWRKHVWGEPESTASIRLDKTNSHTGDCAMSVRTRRDGARPGAFAGVKLELGTYEVSYWAQADVDGRAQVGCHLGGVDLAIQSVGDEWTQFTERVEIEKRNGAASLKLWVQTQEVRVWFDDVAVRLIRAKTD